MRGLTELLVDDYETPIGKAVLVFDHEGALRALDFEDHAARTKRLLHLYYGAAPLTARRAPAAIRAVLRRYFGGDLAALHEAPCAVAGTAFQQAVWSALRRIPPGSTTTYGALARALGKPLASRAVGLANGSNPIGIVVPCHRVIGADGDLTGYGGGVHRKRWLLQHEGVEIE
jgi:methylated-DNA-[protein]-cysteine S-methyltransferase